LFFSRYNTPIRTLFESIGEGRFLMKREKTKLLNDPQSRVKLHLLGSAGHVTGSLFLFEVTSGQTVTRFLLEVGLHQDDDNINHCHRLPKGVNAKDINFAIISHAHIDHSGYLPKLIKDGFTGPVYTHAATKDLLRFLLPDSGNLQERAAERENERNGLNRGNGSNRGPNGANRNSGATTRGSQRATGKPDENRGGRNGNRGATSGGAKRVFPLYTAADARRSLEVIKTFQYDRLYKVAEGISCKFTEASHILGAAVVTLMIGTGKSKKTICFTGNVGRNGMPFLKDLTPVLEADYIITESTYGNKLHAQRDRLEVLAGIINDAYKRAKRRDPKEGCGTIVIPAFAVGRVQTVLYDLRELMAAKRIPDLAVFLDSPMAVEATKVHRKHTDLYNEAARKLVDQGIDPFKTPRYMECKGWAQSRAIDKPASEPLIIIGSSGMAAGGRILAHIEKRLHRAENTVVFVGYQGTGALGYTLVNERPAEVTIHDKVVKVNAKIEYMSDYSGHADYSEIIDWLKKFRRKPKKLFLVHGDTDALSAFKGHIEEALPDWNVVIPQPRNCFEL
jgi:metallo-beta-lactamase family protein